MHRHFGLSPSCFDFIESKGYKFVYDKGDNKRIYLQKNYLKFGKTGNHGGITLPAIDKIPAGENVILQFDWCPMRQGTGKIDPVTLFVEVQNGEDVKKINIPVLEWENGHKLEWVKANADLSGIAITKDTKITISQEEFGKGTANRWFLDNIKVYAADKAGVEGIVVDNEAPVEYFNLQGIRVAEPGTGLYIRRQGKDVKKVFLSK